MKCKELAVVADKVQTFLRNSGADDRVAERFIALVGVTPEGTVAKLCKLIEQGQFGSVSAVIFAGDLVRFARMASQLFEGLAKAQIANDFEVISVALEKHSARDIEEIISWLKAGAVVATKPRSAIREDVVRKYCAALETALGDDDGFNAIFQLVKNDASLSVAELTAIAKRFAAASANSKAKALAKIMARHQSLMTSRARSAATGGRIAG